MTHSTQLTASTPITETWRMSEVLKLHPELLDVLIGVAPAFEKLRNPLLRRVQTRLVTVGQAAQIAGIDPESLVVQLNKAAGLEASDRRSSPSAPAASASEPVWLATAPIVETLDVRPFQQRGEEPFSAIMAATRDVGPGEVLNLRNTFEPVPLYSVLEQRGFEHWTRRLGDNDWEILFFNTGAARSSSPPAPVTSTQSPAEAWDEPSATLTIDVSELVPPEPMIRILTALEELPEGSTLLVHHVRRPMHLYPRLDELGYRHETRELAPDRIEVLIEKPFFPEGQRA